MAETEGNGAHFSLENQENNVDSIKTDDHHNDADNFQRLPDPPSDDSLTLQDADEFLKNAGIDFEQKLQDQGQELPRLVEIERKFKAQNAHHAGGGVGLHGDPVMSEDDIVDFLKKSGAGANDHILSLDELQKFDHAQIDEYLAKTALSDSERHKMRHQIFHLKHKGHEAMHTEMVLVMISMLIIGQICLVQWKKRRPKSYNMMTLLLLWLIPFGTSVYYGWKRFICIWTVFSLITGLPIRKAVWSNKMLPETPRLVYRIFLFMFRICLAVGTVGYLCFLFTMLGLNLTLLISPEIAFDFSFLCLWYGFYFGVVVRDFSDLCAKSIAVKAKFYKDEGDKKESKNSLMGKLPDRQLQPGTCALCGNKMSCFKNKKDARKQPGGPGNGFINNYSAETRLESINLEDFSDSAYGVREPDTSDEEKAIRLSCGHEFHEYCIRGWVILGKQHTCPYCNEKVDTKLLGNHPWEKYNRMYAQLLDWLRYLVAWQPVILIAINGVTHVMGLE